MRRRVAVYALGLATGAGSLVCSSVADALHEARMHDVAQVMQSWSVGLAAAMVVIGVVIFATLDDGANRREP